MTDITDAALDDLAFVAACSPEQMFSDDLLALVAALRSERTHRKEARDEMLAYRVDALRYERDAEDAKNALERERTQNRELRAALALVRSMPVVMNDERRGYDCAGCGAALGAEHEATCPWERAMPYVYPARALAGNEQDTNQ